MRLGVLFSGGKDSCLTLFKSMKEHEAVCLITIVSKNPESFMFHTPNIWITKMQSEAMEIPLIQKTTEGKKEEELEDLKKAIKEAKEIYKIEGIATGAVESVYQSKRIQKICDDLDLLCVNPLWKRDQVELLEEVIENKFKVIISGVFAYPLDEKWLGKEIDREIIEELVKLKEKYQISPSGEGGEIETTVLDAPFFKKRIDILDFEIKAKENSGVFIIKKAKLVEK
jgi:ABC transporter with metal-binding/Fe-S-binding domain ATP-binding protein